MSAGMDSRKYGGEVGQAGAIIWPKIVTFCYRDRKKGNYGGRRKPNRLKLY